MNEKPTEEIKKLPIITKFCMTIGELPTSYLMSLTYLEQVTWLCNFLEKTMIPALNQNAKAVEELQSLFELLRTYVNDYFDNLDVQEEINNKLDEMAESGQLTDIIAQYLGLAGMIAFDNVSDMKEAENLVNGSKCRTLGFRAVNDGGSSLYKVREVTNLDTIDEMTIIALNDENLVAELIIEKTIVPEQLGAYGDGTHDDSTPLQKALNLTNCNIELINKKVYSYATTLSISNKRYYNFNGNGATLKYTGSSNAMLIDMENTTAHQRDMMNIENIVFIAPNSQNVLALNYVIKTNFTNLKIYDFPHNGINLLNSCYECNFNDIYLGCRKTTGTVGITGKFGDTEFGNLYGVNVETFIFGTPWGSNNIQKIHAWCFNGSIFNDEASMTTEQYNTWFANTKLIKVDNTTEANAWSTVINYCNCDTYNSCIDFNSYWQNLHIIDLELNASTNLNTYTTDFRSYQHRMLIDSLRCSTAIEDTISSTIAGRVPHIKFINDREYEYVEEISYTDYNNETQKIHVKYNELRWVEIVKPGADLTLNAINVYMFIPFKKNGASDDVNVRRPYVGTNNNSFIYTTFYDNDTTTAFALTSYKGSVSTDNTRLVPKEILLP